MRTEKSITRKKDWNMQGDVTKAPSAKAASLALSDALASSDEEMPSAASKMAIKGEVITEELEQAREALPNLRTALHANEDCKPHS